MVADLSIPEERLLRSAEAAIRGGIDLLQIWNVQRKDEASTRKICRRLASRSAEKGIPIIINNDLELAEKIGADGIHFDYLTTPEQARKLLGENAVVGYTTGNSQDQVLKAARAGADYISFCAVFPSPSVESCEIVPLEAIRQAKQLVDIPVFASGGITVENAHLVLEAGADGLAIASSILNANDPEASARAFKQIIENYRKIAK